MKLARLRRWALGLAVLIATGASCSDGRSVEAFCDQIEATVDAGPLFPDRTDGEPVPSVEALDAIDELADVAPDAIAPSVEVLSAEAQALVADAERRDDATTTGTDDESTTGATHPTRAEVEAAQVAVADYSADECGVDLRS